MPAGPGQSAVPCRAASPALGLGLHLCLDLAGLGLRGIRGGRVQPAHRGLAAERLDAHRVRARRAGAGAVRPQAA